MTFNKSWLAVLGLILSIGAMAQVDRILHADKIRHGSGLHTVPSSGTSNLVGDSLSQTLTNKTVNADNNTITNIDNNEIKASAGIVYSKLDLTTSIVNGDVAVAAAIARSKLASGTASHVLINDGSGVMSSEANLAVSRGGTGAGSFTANNVLLGNGTSAFQVVAPGTSGNVLTSNGTTWQSTAPAAQAVITKWARVSGGNPPTIDAQGDNTWLTYSSRAAAGDYSWTMTGFSVTPSCTMSVTDSNAYFSGLTAGSSTTLHTTTYNSGAAAQDAAFNLICVGTP